MIKVFVLVLVMVFMTGCNPVGNVEASNVAILNEGRILYDEGRYVPPAAVEFKTSTGVLCVAVYGTGDHSIGAHVTCDWDKERSNESD